MGNPFIDRMLLVQGVRKKAFTDSLEGRMWSSESPVPLIIPQVIIFYSAKELSERKAFFKALLI